MSAKSYSQKRSPQTQRVNRQIRAREVRLIRETGEQAGIVSLQEALRIAEEVGLDLVEVAPQANPPVCRLMDFGKFMYTKSKRERQARKAQAKTEVKEIQLRPKTGEHDINFKVRDARKWLERGAKVKVRIRFRGRERYIPEVGLERLQEVAQMLADVSVIEQKPSFEGRSMIMILAPNKPKT
ncbi:MAG: translation initiation factor IF-3 [Caldilineae bacterium]|nr:MAG: translation initiation factor IF-3 [Caldilineae bacterium]